MPLPSITMPATLPPWLAEGRTMVFNSPVATVPMTTGVPRRRRVLQQAEHAVRAVMHLQGPQAAVFSAWFEEDLLAGTERFAARLLGSGTTPMWWDARFAGPPEWAGVSTVRGADWRLSADLVLRGQPQASL